MQAVTLTCSYEWGMGRHFYYLNPMQRIHAMKWNFMSQPMGILSSMFGRVSFCLFLLNFVGTNKARKHILYFLVITQLLVNCVTILLIFTQCGTHVEALWDQRVKVVCWSPLVQRNTGFGQSGALSTPVNL
jgi:hypothetical protein